MYMLDTNICIYLIKNNPPHVRTYFERLKPGDILLSSIVLAELMYGISKSQKKERNMLALEMFLLPLEIVSFDTSAAEKYGDIRSILEQSGQIIGGNDLFIAAHALSLDVALVTNNMKEFTRVPKLKLENWAEKY
ncbi:MAG: PIN domain-containing protein [Mariprofundaceae bacterium]|nr:PIN domain-containing protein [Mariprofundaceae bacterium]